MSVSSRVNVMDHSGNNSNNNNNNNALWLVLATSVVSVAASFSCFYLMMKTKVFFDSSDGEQHHHQQVHNGNGSGSNKKDTKSMADSIEGNSNEKKEHMIIEDQLHISLKYEVDDEFKDMKDGHGNIVKGAKVKMLSNNPDGSERFILQLELGPDAFYPPHLHGSAEFCFLVRGQMIDNFGLKTAPCYMYNAPYSKHFNIYAGPEGCTILVVK